MKLIHLPSGEAYEEKVQPYKLLNKYPDNYIRATLPEHWRVEGYEKSWEWATPEGVKCKEGEYIEYDVVAYNKFGYNNSACHKPNLPEISRAEFEYHIYNPWKEEQAQLDMSDIDKIREAAEKMGYELVRKEKDMIEWETEHNAFKLIDAGLWIKNLDDDERIFLENHEFDILIEKHNQFLSK